MFNDPVPQTLTCHAHTAAHGPTAARTTNADADADATADPKTLFVGARILWLGCRAMCKKTSNGLPSAIAYWPLIPRSFRVADATGRINRCNFNLYRTLVERLASYPMQQCTQPSWPRTTTFSLPTSTAFPLAGERGERGGPSARQAPHTRLCPIL